jgi:tRNA 2-thiouridine synthesizing protein A
MDTPEALPADYTLDAGEAGCGDLVMLIFQEMKKLAPGQTLRVAAYDAAAEVDVPAWCRSTGHALLAQDLTARPKLFLIQKRV